MSNCSTNEYATDARGGEIPTRARPEGGQVKSITPNVRTTPIHRRGPIRRAGPIPAGWRAAPLVLFTALALGACHGPAPSAAAPALVVALPVHAESGDRAAESIRYPV